MSVERCPYCGKCERAWVAIGGRGLYEVSNVGRVRSWNVPGGTRGGAVRRNKPLVMRPSGRVAGRYPALRVSGKTRTIHSLVLEGFSGIRRAGFVVRHLDCNPLHNCRGNLCYGTCKENLEDTVRLGRNNPAWGERHPRHRLTEQLVVAARDAYRQGCSIAAAAKRFGVAKSAMERALTGRTWSRLPNPVRLRRPVVWSSEIVEAICRRWSAGESLSVVAQCYSVPYRTAYSWIQNRVPRRRREDS